MTEPFTTPSHEAVATDQSDQVAGPGADQAAEPSSPGTAGGAPGTAAAGTASETDGAAGGSVTVEPDPGGHARRVAVLALIALVVLAADQGSKALAVAHLSDGHRVALIGSLFGMELTRNAGAAFSTATSATWVLTLIALVVVGTIVNVARRLGSWGWTVALGLLLGGALGNLSDRLFRAPGFFRGHVIDFLEWPHWPIFNLADSCIVTAAVLIALLSVIGIGIDGRQATNGPGASGDPDDGTGPSIQDA